VGDEDQSIYRWPRRRRFHPPEFFRDFPRPNRQIGTQLPSTQNILDAAGRSSRTILSAGKSLARRKARIESEVSRARDAQAEAEFVAGELERHLNDDSDQRCAVEYRTNFQSRASRGFPQARLALQTVGGSVLQSRRSEGRAWPMFAWQCIRRMTFRCSRIECSSARHRKTTVDALRESARVEEHRCGRL